MGILESITSQLFGSGTSARIDLVNAVIAMLGNRKTGGLAGLVEQFSQRGLREQVRSWVGIGENLPATGEQIHQALGSQAINQLALQSGLSADQVASHLADLLPWVIDKLTPDGRVEQSNVMSKGAELLGFLGT